MATTIAKVTGELSERRGPDVLHRISVPPEWMLGGAQISVPLPKLLSCANCEGGGCDACGRRGALTIREASAKDVLRVRLAASASGQAQLIRIPERGAKAEDPTWPLGCLMLRVEPGACTTGVKTLAPPATDRRSWVGFSKIWLLLPLLTLAVWWLMRSFGG